MIAWRQHLRNWWSRSTIRFRLALWYAAGGTLLLALFSATLYWYVAAHMALPLDTQLREDLAQVERSLHVTSERAVLWEGAPLPSPAPWMTDHPWFELWDPQGNLVRRVWPFVEDRAFHPPGPPARPSAMGTISVFHVAPDLRIRALTVLFNNGSASAPWTLRLMRVHQRYADALPALRLIILLALPVVVALLVLGGHYFTRRWLLPLDRMAHEANLITASDLSRRLSATNPHDELGRLSSAFNVTLDRLEESFQTLDRFVADASHELRTPLTTLRSVGEVGLRRSRTVEEYREIIGSMLEEAQRLQLLIQRLLELASVEGGSQTARLSPLRLDEAAASWINEFAILAEQKNQRLVVDGLPCSVVTDPVVLRQALQNLVDNAIKYGPPNSTIRVSIAVQENDVAISVVDEGPGIRPADRAHLAKRFFRPDRARDRQTGGFGLGLSITKAYLRTLGGSLEYEPAQPKGSIFRIILPRR